VKQGSNFVLGAAITLLNISLTYFIGLVLYLPFPVTVLFAGVSAFFATRFLRLTLTPGSRNISTKDRIPLLISIIGLQMLVYQSYRFGTKDGVWDAWAIWNLHAKFLASPDNWQLMLHTDTDPHPDYPLALPSIIAFIKQLTYARVSIVAYTIATTVFILIPALVFAELRKYSVVAATIILAWFVIDNGYAKLSLYQTADTLLAFFLLCTILMLRHYRNSGNARFLALAGAFMGACIWTKNEGALLAAIILAFNAEAILSKRNPLWFSGGVALPVFCYTVFKFGYAPANDLVLMREKISISFLVSPERYGIIWNSLKLEFGNAYFCHMLALILYTVILIWKRAWPEKDILTILACFVAYLGVYLFTPMDLQWHINTSFDRLIHQLAPTFMLLVGVQLATLLPENKLAESS
jgi:hypothetical protein